MDISNFKVSKLSTESVIIDFDCGDEDLNDFILSDALSYQNHLLAVTYILDSSSLTGAYFSLLADKIKIDDAVSNNWWRKNIRNSLPLGKHFSSYHAIKIGRLAVNKKLQGSGIGTDLMYFIKELVSRHNFLGARFITVDAYKQSLKYYEKNGFKYLTTEDKEDDTRLMYFDLGTIL
jgi:predicted GNAT family N-acyltransferase